MFIYTEKSLKKPLNKEEFINLMKFTKEGDIDARTRLIEHNLRLVIFEVQNKFKMINYDKDDLISVGIIGLSKAIDTFNLDKNYEFSTYAIRCIDNEIHMFLRYVNKVNALDSLDRIIAIHNDSINFTISDILRDEINVQEEFNNKELYDIIRKIVYNLPEKEKEIILLSFGFYNNRIYTQKEIAKILNTSQAGVSKTRAKALNDISNILQEIKLLEPKDINLKLKKLNK